MKISFRKAIISVSAAVAMLVSSVEVATTISPTTAQAASNPGVTLSTSASNAEPGNTFTVSVGYNPGSSGAATVEFNIRYDSSKLELSGTKKTSGKFDPVQVIDKGNGTVSVYALYGNGGNVTSSDSLCSITLKAKSGASGSAKISIDGLEMYDGTTYSLVSSSAPSAVSVNIASATTTTTTTTTTKATTTTPKATEAPKVTTTPTNATTTTPKVTNDPDASSTTAEPDVTTDEDTTETTPAESELPSENDEKDDQGEETPDISEIGSGAMAEFLRGLKYTALRCKHDQEFNNACFQLAYYLNGGVNIDS